VREVKLEPMRNLASLPIALGLLLAACGEPPPGPCEPFGRRHKNHCHCDPGYEEGPEPLTCVPERAPSPRPSPADAGVDADAAASPSDASTTIDGGEASRRAWSVTLEAAEVNVDDRGQRTWVYRAQGAAQGLLRIEVYEAFGGPSQPGQVVLTAADTDFATCGVCVRLSDQCVVGRGCARTFMPREGGVVVLEAMGTMPGERFAGRLEGLQFDEVMIDAQSLSTARVPGGVSFALDDFAWSLGLPEPPCGGHGTLHGDHCHCDPGYRPDPRDPLRCVPR
jgi:hypothetical protein